MSYPAETTSRDDQLNAWLDRVNARECWTAKIPGGNGAKVQGYNINGQLAIVLRHSDEDGWDLLVPSSKTNSIVDALDGAAETLGVDGCSGLIVGPRVAAKGGAA